jgi:hypothetical protein
MIFVDVHSISKAFDKFEIELKISKLLGMLQLITKACPTL